MNASSVERLKTKVEELITTFESQRAELEQLTKENESLKSHIDQLTDQLKSKESNASNTELLKEKVNKLIQEVDSCIELANG